MAIVKDMHLQEKEEAKKNIAEEFVDIVMNVFQTALKAASAHSLL